MARSTEGAQGFRSIQITFQKSSTSYSPYAEFWGMADDWAREELIRNAPPNVRANLKQVIATYDLALDEWLGGPEAHNREPSGEYVAFSAMRIAGYSV